PDAAWVRHGRARRRRGVARLSELVCERLAPILSPHSEPFGAHHDPRGSARDEAKHGVSDPRTSAHRRKRAEVYIVRTPRAGLAVNVGRYLAVPRLRISHPYV